MDPVYTHTKPVVDWLQRPSLDATTVKTCQRKYQPTGSTNSSSAVWLSKCLLLCCYIVGSNCTFSRERRARTFVFTAARQLGLIVFHGWLASWLSGFDVFMCCVVDCLEINKNVFFFFLSFSL